MPCPIWFCSESRPAEGDSNGRDSFVTLETVEIRRRARAFSASWAGVTSEQSDKQPELGPRSVGPSPRLRHADGNHRAPQVTDQQQPAPRVVTG
jgi:hypothetical protein